MNLLDHLDHDTLRLLHLELRACTPLPVPQLCAVDHAHTHARQRWQQRLRDAAADPAEPEETP